MANLVARPPSRIFEKPWRSGDIPEAWKRATDISFFKKGPQEETTGPLVLICAWESKRTSPARNYYRTNDAGDWEMPLAKGKSYQTNLT